MKLFAKKKKKTIESSENFVLNEKSSFLSKEDYKTLRTNIEFLFSESKARVIAVTSSNRSEGKSTNSINLAISYAELGRKVLLVDCDLRLPTVAAKLQIQPSKKKGLSNILVENLSYKDAIHKQTDSGIHIITAGTIPPDPTRLLQSERMSTLLESLRQEYDYIILDCPPVNAVVDALLLAPIIDGYVLIVRHEETEHKDMTEMLAKLKHVSANVLGFVYAGAPTGGNKYYKKANHYYK